MAGKKNKSKHAKRYNWHSLKEEFISGEWVTVSSFLEDKDIPMNPNTAKKTKGWSKVKDKIKEKAMEKATESMIDHAANDIEEVKYRQANFAKWMQVKGMEAMKSLEIDKSDDARKLIQTGMIQERAVLGIGGRGGASLTQVNVNLPKTRFDDMLDGLGYEETLELIAEVKRLRTRGTRVEVVGDGSAETE